MFLQKLKGYSLHEEDGDGDALLFKPFLEFEAR
jgi:hypothetical protein